ncbi:hypothetical protein JB92DRAFT_2875199 [Gautieria morchelliformis]|nr:hypothetical protein JB92DRAFT_2875199 [Gautieria morchelliformis]
MRDGRNKRRSILHLPLMTCVALIIADQQSHSLRLKMLGIPLAIEVSLLHHIDSSIAMRVQHAIDCGDIWSPRVHIL